MLMHAAECHFVTNLARNIGRTCAIVLHCHLNLQVPGHSVTRLQPRLLRPKVLMRRFQMARHCFDRNARQLQVEPQQPEWQQLRKLQEAAG